MKEVVWVIGASAAGKETFVRRALEDEALQEQLGWATASVVASEISVGSIGMYDDDPAIERRAAISEEVPRLLKLNDIVLVKWQFVDTKADRIQQVRDENPEATHRGVVLHAPRDEMIERLKTKPWWDRPGEEEWFVDEEVGQIEDVVRDLESLLDIQHLNSGVADNYENAK